MPKSGGSDDGKNPGGMTRVFRAEELCPWMGMSFDSVPCVHKANCIPGCFCGTVQPANGSSCKCEWEECRERRKFRRTMTNKAVDAQRKRVLMAERDLLPRGT